MALSCPKCGFTLTGNADEEIYYCQKCGTKLIEINDPGEAVPKLDQSQESGQDLIIEKRSIESPFKIAFLLIALSIIIGIIINAFFDQPAKKDAVNSGNSNNYGMTTPSQQYEEGINLLENSKWEEAASKLEGLKYQDSETLYNYANMETEYINHRYFNCEQYLMKISDDYKGQLASKILNRKHELLSQLPALKKEQLRNESDLEVLNWKWYRSSDYYVEAAGEVKNISGEPLENVTAVVSFYTKDGTFVTSSEALVDFNPILPGQVSPFHVIETFNPEMSKANLQFKFLLGGTINSFSDT